MAKCMPLAHFRVYAIISLASMMAEYENATVPASLIGGFLRHITQWDKTALMGLIKFFGQAEGACVAQDWDLLLRYAPPKKFESEADIIEWTLDISDIRNAVDIAARWGFWNTPKEPKAGTQWNAVLIAGLGMVGRHIEGQIKREDVFALFHLLGMSQEDTLKAIDVHKKVCGR